jgi:bisphosphoglycerate-dependent phosphoglycerate mutase
MSTCRRGIAEAHAAARLLAEAGLGFDVTFTSVQKRAIRTLRIVADDLDRMWVPVHRRLKRASSRVQFAETPCPDWKEVVRLILAPA